MDISSFLSGNFLTQLDLPEPLQTWKIAKVDQQMVGSDQKVCVTFAEFPSKPLGANKTNLRGIASLYSTDASRWVGQPLQVYRAVTGYQGKSILCIRVCAPNQLPPEPVVDRQGNPVSPQPKVEVLAKGDTHDDPWQVDA